MYVRFISLTIDRPRPSCRGWVVTKDGRRRRSVSRIACDHIQFMTDPPHSPRSSVPFFLSFLAPFRSFLGSECTRCQRKRVFYLRGRVRTCREVVVLGAASRLLRSSTNVGCISCLAPSIGKGGRIQDRDENSNSVMPSPMDLNGDDHADAWARWGWRLKTSTPSGYAEAVKRNIVPPKTYLFLKACTSAIE